MIDIEERTNRVLNIVKAKFGFKTKSEAINYVAHAYEMEFMEPELRPEFVKKMKKLEKEANYVEIKDFKKHFDIK